jgi:hypothetical protein
MSDEEEQEKPDESSGEERIAWHPAFFEAIQIELDEYSHVLQFMSELQLTTEPLRIDAEELSSAGDNQKIPEHSHQKEHRGHLPKRQHS